MHTAACGHHNAISTCTPLQAIMAMPSDVHALRCGMLPVSAGIPDMHATTQAYLRLQQVLLPNSIFGG